MQIKNDLHGDLEVRSRCDLHGDLIRPGGAVLVWQWRAVYVVSVCERVHILIKIGLTLDRTLYIAPNISLTPPTPLTDRSGLEASQATHRSATVRRARDECILAGDGLAEDESVDIVCTLVRVDGLEVGRMSHDVVFILDSIPAKHVAAVACNLESLATRVALHEGDHLG